MTNYEKIKVMSVEEMAELLDVPSCINCGYHDSRLGISNRCGAKFGATCESGHKLWLQQEAEE